MSTVPLNLTDSNHEIIKLIENKKPFSIVRLGIGNETFLTYEYLLTNTINENRLHAKYKSLYNAGIYSKTKDISKILLYLQSYNNAIKNSDLLASFLKNSEKMTYIQNFFSNKYHLPQIYSRALEPFYQIQEKTTPWSHYLLGKKVLVINPFVKSFEKQVSNHFQIFKDQNKKLFLDGQEFIFYKSFQTIAGNHIHEDWVETFTIMCNDIEQLEFDIALLGCGGYGLPLCDFIKTKLNKSAIYVGGGLQLLFGVMGKRWENNNMWQDIIKTNDTKFIKPSEDEICDNLTTIEGGCYW